MYQAVESGASGRQDEQRWNLQVVKRTGKVWFQTVEEADGTGESSEGYECSEKRLVVADSGNGETWNIGKPVKEICFGLGACSAKSGKEECDIKILLKKIKKI